ncbi:MAG: protoporphyrinogen oxidase [Desulfobulbaceae bacterium]|nr:MAG: protoporphyrinogen oxidase [Desulfobulbaceae bacterium]
MTENIKTIIVGAGLSGLVVAQKLKQFAPSHQFRVLDQASHCGGAIRSISEHGFKAEIGPHGFLDNCLESRQLLEQTGLDKEIVKASLSTFVRYVCINGSLMMIPQSPLKIIKAPLIPWKDKFRVLGELFKQPLEGEPTVAKWANYRFGKALLPYVDAVFTGTYAGDFNELKIDAVMPGVRELEKTHGSIIKGVLSKALKARKAKPKGKKLEMPAMTSFPEGMQRLPERLAELLEPGQELLLNCQVNSVHQATHGWAVETDQGTMSAENLVIALPVNESLKLIGSTLPEAPVNQIPEAWIATVVFGFERAQLPPGFGFLIPESEKRFTLGTLFSSNMFPGRAPNDHIVFETLVGGRRHPERLEIEDKELIARSLADIRGLLNLPAEPKYTKVLRPSSGIPQLEKGYTSLLNWRNQLMVDIPSLFICGFGWDGIGINDMIKKATRIGEQLVSGEAHQIEANEVKKVYF